MDRPPLLVFAEDWGRHMSGCQQIIRQLLNEHQVLWVNTIGTRKPRLDRLTLRRGLQKAWDWMRLSPQSYRSPRNLLVRNPLMWPWFSSELDRWINKRLLTSQLTPMLRKLAQPAVAITKVPISADLLDTLPVQHWVYYCVDDYSEWPGLDQMALRKMEAKIIARADRLIAVSEPLREKLARMGRQADLLTHGVDLAMWRSQETSAIPPPTELDRLERPLIAFWGTIDRRIDTAIVRRLATAMRRGTLVFAGPEQSPDPELHSLPRTTSIGTLPFAQLPDLARAASALVMPYADLPVTRAMQPLKLMEYLATGLPVVARDLPSSRAWSDALDLASNPAEFAGAVMHRLETGLPAGQRNARKRLDSESWDVKARKFAEFALGEARAIETVGTTR